MRITFNDDRDEYKITHIHSPDHIDNEFVNIHFGWDCEDGYDTSSVTIDVNKSFWSDWLRSKGYAVSYLGLSVKEQVDRGWVKLKNKHN